MRRSATSMYGRFANFKRTIVTAAGVVKGAPRREPGKMNPNEARYADHLTNQPNVREWHFESFKVRLADTTFIDIDFTVFLDDYSMEFHEVKVFWKNLDKVHIEDDSRVKLKWVQEKYPIPLRIMFLHPTTGLWTQHPF
ncbi:MAG: hypothetical protein Q7U76_12665 [Nitrospirota bacterium]|nr:hypothetical protein [Nitrospirota bacterium]